MSCSRNISQQIREHLQQSSNQPQYIVVNTEKEGIINPSVLKSVTESYTLRSNFADNKKYQKLRLLNEPYIRNYATGINEWKDSKYTFLVENRQRQINSQLVERYVHPVSQYKTMKTAWSLNKN